MKYKSKVIRINHEVIERLLQVVPDARKYSLSQLVRLSLGMPTGRPRYEGDKLETNLDKDDGEIL